MNFTKLKSFSYKIGGSTRVAEGSEQKREREGDKEREGERGKERERERVGEREGESGRTPPRSAIYTSPALLDLGASSNELDALCTGACV